MTSLQEHLDCYLSVRRSLGYQLDGPGRVLPDFVRFAQAKGETTVRAKTATVWAGGSASEGQRRVRLSMVRGFARFLVAFDATTEIPPCGLHPAPVRSAPHIYTEQEIARLMSLASRLKPAPFGATMATLIGLMASTGLRPGETRRLDRDHVDLAGGQLTVWHSKFGRSRRLPLHPTTVQALANYSVLRDRFFPDPDEPAFFLDRAGARLDSGQVSHAFRKLRGQASIVTGSGRRAAVLGEYADVVVMPTPRRNASRVGLIAA